MLRYMIKNQKQTSLITVFLLEDKASCLPPWRLVTLDSHTFSGLIIPGLRQMLQNMAMNRQGMSTKEIRQERNYC